MISPVPSILSLELVSSIPFKAWGDLPPLTSSLKGDQAKIPDQHAWLRFLGKELKEHHLTNGKPKAHLYIWRINHTITRGKEETWKRQVGWEEKGGELSFWPIRIHWVTVIERFLCRDALRPNSKATAQQVREEAWKCSSGSQLQEGGSQCTDVLHEEGMEGALRSK